MEVKKLTITPICSMKTGFVKKDLSAQEARFFIQERLAATRVSDVCPKKANFPKFLRGFVNVATRVIGR